MDNLSHLVAGLAAGELIHRMLPREADPDRHAARRKLLLFSCAAANNVPDLDLVLTPLLPAPLGYLLHHRGHTHTLLYLIPQALGLLLATFLLWPGARRLARDSGPARRGALAAVATGFLLHLLMDSLNSYGIHPFHPFDARWLYGDLVYIVEPFFWVVFGVPLAMMVPSLRLRFMLLALPLAAVVFFTVRGFLLPASLGLLALVALAAALAQYRSGTRGRSALVAVFCCALAFVALQGAASSYGRSTITAALARTDPANRVLDVAMTAFPANPLCWSFVSVQVNRAAGTFSLRRGVASLAPALLAPARCPAAMLAAGGPPDAGAPAPDDGLIILNRREASLAALRELHRSNCHANAWLRFVRVPALGGGAGWDLRYGTGPEHNFSAIRFGDFAGKPCPQGVPQWTFPRADLLGSQ